MNPRELLFRSLVLISVVTVLSGLAQLLAPRLVLALVGGEVTPTSAHFFGIVGMFMVLFGGALLHALLSSDAQPVVVLWAGLQKLGAAAAVGLGVTNGIFSMLALLVAGFDLLSGVLIFAYLRGVSGATKPPRWQDVPRIRVPGREVKV